MKRELRFLLMLMLLFCLPCHDRLSDRRRIIVGAPGVARYN